jgi:GPI mannosyltransferase 2
MVLFNSNTRLATYAVALFCLNPANIFFSSIYSESMYSMLTFASLYYIYSKRSWLVSLICLFLCCLCRSNGVLNFGFIAYFLLKEQLNRCQIEKKYYDELNSVFKYIKFLFKKYRLGLSSNSNLLFLTKVIVSFVSIGSAFVVYQYYIYTQFCLVQKSQTRIPNKLVEYAREQDYVIINDINLPQWCNKTIFSYNSIQNKYWNVGFLTYWNFRQIPNFILASPIIVLCLLALRHYFYSLKNQKHLFSMLCLVSLKEQIQSSKFNQNESLFPFAIHLIVLLFSSVFFMHVQVKMKPLHQSLN